MQRSRSSYTTNDLGSFALWLQHQGYKWIPSPNNPHEAARFIRQGSIVVCFKSNSVLIQGQNQEATRKLLDTYAPESEVVL
jgi:ribonuclease HIII